MIVCRGEGMLMINPADGDILWAEMGSPAMERCRQKNYKDADSLAALLGLDISLLSLPPCSDCAHVGECQEAGDLVKERERLCCVGVDGNAVSTAIKGALEALGEADLAQLSLRV